MKLPKFVLTDGRPVIEQIVTGVFLFLNLVWWTFVVLMFCFMAFVVYYTLGNADAAARFVFAGLISIVGLLGLIIGGGILYGWAITHDDE